MSKFKIKTIFTLRIKQLAIFIVKVQKNLKFEFETRRYYPIISFNIILQRDNIVYIQI